jgi:hypothetical protein
MPSIQTAPAERQPGRRPVASHEPADQLLHLARAVERLGWDRATPEQALAAKLHVRDELRRIARDLEPRRCGR